MAARALPRTGPFIDSPTRVVSGLVQRFGRLDFVSDTTGALGGSLARPERLRRPHRRRARLHGRRPRRELRRLPRRGALGSLAPSIPAPSAPARRLPQRGALGSAAAPSAPASTRSPTSLRCSWRQVFLPGLPPVKVAPSVWPGAPRRAVPNRLTEALDGLRTPVAPGDNLQARAADLDAFRQHVLATGETVVAMTRQVRATVNEFNSARGLTPDGRRSQVRQRGRQLRSQPATTTPRSKIFLRIRPRRSSTSSSTRTIRRRRISGRLRLPSRSLSAWRASASSSTTPNSRTGGHRYRSARSLSAGCSSRTRTDSLAGPGNSTAATSSRLRAPRRQLRQQHFRLTGERQNMNRQARGEAGPPPAPQPPPQPAPGATQGLSRRAGGRPPVHSRLGPRVLDDLNRTPALHRPAG